MSQESASTSASRTSASATLAQDRELKAEKQAAPGRDMSTATRIKAPLLAASHRAGAWVREAKAPGTPLTLSDILHRNNVKSVLAMRAAVAENEPTATSRLFKPPQTLVWVNADDSLEIVMGKLRKNGILGAPVIREGRVMGFIDMLDIVNFVLGAAITDPTQPETIDLKKLNISAHMSAQTPVSQAMGIGGETFMAVSEEDTLSYVAHLFTEQCLHRVAVYNPETKEFTSVLTQVDLVRWIAHTLENNQAVSGMTTKKLKDIDTGKGAGPIKISARASVFQALQRLSAMRVSGLAVVHPDTDRLIGNFSASNLKNFTEQFSQLMKPVSEFLEEQSPDSLKLLLEPAESRPLLDTCKAMLADRVHRLWVVDRDTRPVSVITMTDIIRIASSE